MASAKVKVIAILLLLLTIGSNLAFSVNAEEESSKPNTTGLTAYKNHFDPKDTKTIVGLVFLGIMLLLATLAGVGGNGMIIPVCLFFFDFDPKVAVAHASIFAAIGSIGRMAYEKSYQHYKGETTKSLTNYHLILLAGPPAVLGAFVGTTINSLISEAILMVVTFLVQMGLVYETFRMFQKKRVQENAAKGSFVTAPGQSQTEITEESKSALRLTDLNSATAAPPKSIQTSLSISDLVVFTVLMFLSPTFTLLRGTKSRESLIGNTVCTTFDIFLLVAYPCILILFSLLVNEIVLLRNFGRKFYRAENDVKIDAMFSFRFISVIFIVTTLGALVSTGSSTLISLVLIWIGLSPFLASSTCLIVVIIFSGSSAMIYYLNGQIYLPCALIGGAVVLVATIITRMTVYQSFLKHGKASLILLFISLTMLMTVPSNIYQVYPHIKEDHDKGKNIWAFNKFCS
jgi:uncharacterized membrane protein YfcA